MFKKLGRWAIDYAMSSTHSAVEEDTTEAYRLAEFESRTATLEAEAREMQVRWSINLTDLAVVMCMLVVILVLLVHVVRKIRVRVVKVYSSVRDSRGMIRVSASLHALLGNEDS